MVTTEVKEHPIIMQADMVKATLDGSKTMTRRTYGLDRVNNSPNDWEFKRLNNGAIALFWRVDIYDEDIALCKCPYGRVGDRLWVRETWAPFLRLDYVGDKTGFRVEYKAGGVEDKYCTVEQAERLKARRGTNWDSPLFMPRWASRILLEITEVRAERLHPISLNEIYAEGCPIERATIFDDPPEAYAKESDAFEWFNNLWNSINSKRGYGWETNPWVWVISYKRITP